MLNDIENIEHIENIENIENIEKNNPGGAVGGIDRGRIEQAHAGIRAGDWQSQGIRSDSIGEKEEASCILNITARR